MEIAKLDYLPKGYVVDFIIIPDVEQPTTFLTGQTYYIKTSYSSGSSITFQPGCFIKYKNNANMLLYGPISFPATGQPMPVFTSRNDNNFGDVISGVPGEANSDGNPALHKAAQAIWIYYVNFNTTIRNARIRWAQKGVQYDVNSGVYITHTLNSSLLEYADTGVYVNLQNATLVLSDTKKCTVTTAVSCAGYPYYSCGTISGSMIEDCGVVSTARVNNPAQDSASGDPNKNSQSECSFVVVNSSTIVAAFFDTHLSAYLLGNVSFPGIVSPRSTGWAVSNDGGATFTDNGAIPPASPANTTQGDAGDPVMARNTASGHIYLLVNPSRETATWKGFRLWKSTDNGQSFALVNSDIFNGTVAKADRDAIAVNNFSGLANSGHLYVAGWSQADLQIHVAHSSTGGASWDGIDSLGPGFPPDVAIRPDGTVYLFYLVSTYNSGTGKHDTAIQYKWLRVGQGSWNGPQTVPAHQDSALFYSGNFFADGMMKRSNSAVPDDYFLAYACPRVAVNPVNGRIYLVYADLPYLGSTTDRGDVFANEGVPNLDGSMTWTGVRKVNNDGTTTDQWNPSVAVNPAGTQIFVGYYSRQTDPSNNALIMAFGSKASLANGLAIATFDVFPIRATAFPPLFPGTTASTPPANTWMYDHVWAQTEMCLDSNALIISCPSPFYEPRTSVTYQHFMADDYTWAIADGSYFYYAWCDRSETYFSGGNSRPDPNVRLGKIRQ